MNESELLNVMRREAERTTRDDGTPLQGIVTSYDPKTYSVKLTLQPDGIPSNWMPVGTLWAGNGWGMLAPPPAGTQMTILFQEGDKDSPIAVCALFDEAHLPPAGTPTPQQGEFLIFHASGSYFYFPNSGKVQFNSTVEIDAGDVANAFQTLCTQAFYNWVVNHVHTGGTLSGSLTGKPNTTPPDDSLTAILKAN